MSGPKKINEFEVTLTDYQPVELNWEGRTRQRQFPKRHRKRRTWLDSFKDLWATILPAVLGGVALIVLFRFLE